MINIPLILDISHQLLGPFNKSQQTGLEILLHNFQHGTVSNPRWIAYMLATVWHETAFTFYPIDEYGSNEYFEKRYGYQTKIGRNLGNLHPNDGSRFHGRGYVQLTGRYNYTKVGQLLQQDLTADPELVKNPNVAYQILTQGMIDGWFTGKRLKDYITPVKCDYVNARRIINGTDKAQQIAQYAEKFEVPLI